MKREELKILTDQCASLAELQELGKRLGYKENWAGHVWAARGGSDDPGAAA